MSTTRTSLALSFVVVLLLGFTPAGSAQTNSVPPAKPPAKSPPPPAVPKPQTARPVPPPSGTAQRRPPVQQTAPPPVPVRGNASLQTPQRQTNVAVPRVPSSAETSPQATLLKGERSRMSGVNHADLPPGRLTVNPDHSMALAGTNGRNYLLRPNGSVLSYQNNGRRALLDPSGHVRALQTHDMIINRGALGEHRIQALQPGGGSIVSFGPNHGYVERPISLQEGTLLQRVVLSRGHTSTSVYRSFSYGNATMAAYLPNAYFRPTFYSWLGSSWHTPVSYQWTWTKAGASTTYAGYYAPSTSYSSPDQWVTDAVLQATLDEGYANGFESNQAAGQTVSSVADLPVLASPAPAPISPQLKAQIGAQVARDIAMERTEAAQITADPSHGPPMRRDVPAALDPAVQVFVVASTLEVVSGTQQCQLREGDILFLSPSAANGATSAEPVVKSSLKGDCPAEVRVKVSVRDLQEMSNHFRENICSAEQTIVANEGNTGLPKPPDPKPLFTAPVAKATSEQDAQTAQAINQLQTRAAQEETSVEGEMSAPGSSH